MCCSVDLDNAFLLQRGALSNLSRHWAMLYGHSDAQVKTEDLQEALMSACRMVSFKVTGYIMMSCSQQSKNNITNKECTSGYVP